MAFFFSFFCLFPSFSLQPLVGMWLEVCMEPTGWLPWGCRVGSTVCPSTLHGLQRQPGFRLSPARVGEEL